MCIVVYSSERFIILCALSLMLMYRHFNKPHFPMLHALLFSLFQYASTVVTYMIVLLQFDQTDKSQNACSRNATNWVTWRFELVYVMWQRKLHILLLSSSLLLLLLLLLSSSSSSTRSPLLSMHQHAVSGRYFLLRDRLYMWQKRYVGLNPQTLIFWPIAGRQWATW